MQNSQSKAKRAEAPLATSASTVSAAAPTAEQQQRQAERLRDSERASQSRTPEPVASRDLSTEPTQVAAQKVASLVEAKARADAAQLASRLQAAYDATLASELRRLIGDEPTDYFRIDFDALPAVPDPGVVAGSYLETIEVKALPGAS